MSKLLEKEMKGSILNAAIKNIIEKYGQDKHELIMSKISDEAKAMMSGLVVSTGWYPVIYYEEYLEQASQVLFNGDRDKAIERGKQTGIEKFSKGVYSMFAKFGSPKFVISKAAVASEKMVRGYAIVKTDFQDHHAVIEYAGMAREFKNYELAILGFDMGAIEASGGKNVKGKIVKSCTEGEEGSMKLEITWE